MRISDGISDVCSSDLIDDPYGECVPDNHVSQGQLPPGLAQYIPDSKGGIDRGSFKAVLVSFANQLDLDKFKISAITGYTTWENFAYGNFDETSYSQLQTRSEEHTSELQSLMRISYAVFCLKKQTNRRTQQK